MSNQFVSLKTQPQLGHWYYVTGVVTQPNGYLRLYVNGKLDRKILVSNSLDANVNLQNIAQFNVQDYIWSNYLKTKPTNDTDRFFGYSLSVATGENGKDKFILTIDG